jgi:hypothetical protein
VDEYLTPASSRRERRPWEPLGPGGSLGTGTERNGQGAGNTGSRARGTRVADYLDYLGENLGGQAPWLNIPNTGPSTPFNPASPFYQGAANDLTGLGQDVARQRCS